ncbi:hypothetical protein AKJ16_DCAP12968 [Drosera capensis]
MDDRSFSHGGFLLQCIRGSTSLMEFSCFILSSARGHEHSNGWELDCGSTWTFMQDVHIDSNFLSYFALKT